jgi:hypothetical protein
VREGSVLTVDPALLIISGKLTNKTAQGEEEGGRRGGGEELSLGTRRINIIKASRN